jgi:hypothetical protein
MSLWATSTLCFNGSSFVFSKLGFSESYAFAIKETDQSRDRYSLSKRRSTHSLRETAPII